MKKFFLLLLICISCGESTTDKRPLVDNDAALQNKKECTALLQKHLDAVTNRDLATLKSTLSPEGKMTLLLPGSEIIKDVDGFMGYHEEWFKDTTTVWSFETKILETDVSETMGIGITEIIYREPERNGEPYFNRMHVSYALEKIDGSWCVIKDHAASIEKSTDKK